MAAAALIRAAALASVLLVAAAPVPPAATPISRLALPWWQARHAEKLAELRRGPVDLVFLGDSITQDFELSGPEPFKNFTPVWQHYYGDRRAVNLGFKGDATSHLLWRLQHGELDGIAPKAAVILIGANNLGRLHWPADETVQGISAVVREVQRRLPATKMLLLGVLPSIRSEWATRGTQQIDTALAARFGGGRVPGVTYLDLAPLFLDRGTVDATRFFDGHLTPPEPPLHPTPQMQARMADAIEPWISATLGDRRREP
jgi:lysophospholipase L1-like esterase